jgi:hypothetical protein
VSDSDRAVRRASASAVDYAASIAQYTTDAGVGPDIVMYFQPWRTATGACATFNEFPFLPNKVDRRGREADGDVGAAAGRRGPTQPSFTYAQILAGAQDACITRTRSR